MRDYKRRLLEMSVLAALAAGVGIAVGQPIKPQLEMTNERRVELFIDPDTSCEYLIAFGYGGGVDLAPRLNGSGNPSKGCRNK